MAVDPLSSATRTAKRNLLIASALAITYRSFDITIDKIPFSGLSINFDPRVFVFLLTIALLYFTLTFALYYYIDVRNIEETPHQAEAGDKYFRGTSLHIIRAANRLEAAVTAILPPGYHTRPADHAFHRMFEEVAASPFKDAILFRIRPNSSLLHVFHDTSNIKTTSNFVDITPETHPEIYKDFERIAPAYIRFHWFASRLNKLRFARQRLTVSAIYPFRNYFVDGILPLSVAALAIASLYRLVDLHWIRDIAPSG
jgi:hypothetical protein